MTEEGEATCLSQRSAPPSDLSPRLDFPFDRDLKWLDGHINSRNTEN